MAARIPVIGPGVGGISELVLDEVSVFLANTFYPPLNVIFGAGDWVRGASEERYRV